MTRRLLHLLRMTPLSSFQLMAVKKGSVMLTGEGEGGRREGGRREGGRREGGREEGGRGEEGGRNL